MSDQPTRKYAGPFKWMQNLQVGDKTARFNTVDWDMGEIAAIVPGEHRGEPAEIHVKYPHNGYIRFQGRPQTDRVLDWVNTAILLDQLEKEQRQARALHRAAIVEATVNDPDPNGFGAEADLPGMRE